MKLPIKNAFDNIFLLFNIFLKSRKIGTCVLSDLIAY